MRDYYEETYGLEPDLLKVPASALGVADPFESVSCSPMKSNGVLIDDTFAEAFGMRADRDRHHRGQPALGAPGRRDDDRLRDIRHRLRLRSRHRPGAPADLQFRLPL